MPTQEDLLRIRKKALAQEAPYDYQHVTPSKTELEYTDSQNEAATIARWHPILAKHGATIIGVADIPDQPYEFVYDDVIWKVKVLHKTDDVEIPEAGYNRFVALQAEQVPFGWFLWADEQFADIPSVRPAQAKQRTPPQVTPNPDRATPKTAPEWETWGSMFTRWWGDVERARDPLFIGVIPTAPTRGVWVVISKWFH